MNYNTFHGFMKRNNITPFRGRFLRVLDAELREELTMLSKLYPNSGLCERQAHL